MQSSINKCERMENIFYFKHLLHTSAHLNIYDAVLIVYQGHYQYTLAQTQKVN